MDERTAPTLLTVVGGLCGAVTVVGLSLVDQWQVLPAVLLAGLWWLAGAVAVRARPDSASARLLLTVGAAHLVSFALSSALAVTRPEPTWATWIVGMAAVEMYAVGFAALATLLVVFPAARIDGRRRRAFAWSSLAVATVATVVLALTSPELGVLDMAGARVPAPAPLPLGSTAIDLFAALMLLVAGSLGWLVVRTRRASGQVREQLMWPTGVAAVLVVMLVATPFGESLFGSAWSLAFVVVVGALPMALLAGVVRYRLFEVDLYVARTLAVGVVVTGVVALYAGLVWIAEGLGSTGRVAAVALAVVAALLGSRVLALVTDAADRLLAGGRVRRGRCVAHLDSVLDHPDLGELAQRTVTTVRAGLDVTGVRLRLDGRVIAEEGAIVGDATVAVSVEAGGEQIGLIECGPRRGGWDEEAIALLATLARHAGLALHGAALSAELAERMQEVVESRARLIRAEDDVRRRLERDLHDGIQQQLVVLLARLEMLRASLGPNDPQAALVEACHEQARRSLVELRDLVAGVRPALLEDHGLVAAVRAQASRLPLEMSVDVDPRLEEIRFSRDLESAAYFVFCEAATNVVKHAGVGHARVVLTPLDDGGIQLAVVDEGRGIVDRDGGSGLVGLRDRVDALGGSLEVQSTTGVGTTVVARLPEREAAHA